MALQKLVPEYTPYSLLSDRPAGQDQLAASPASVRENKAAQTSLASYESQRDVAVGHPA